MARHSGSGFYAAGKPEYVASAAAGHAIGEAIRAQADFNDCMSAGGWVIADAQAQAVKKGGPTMQQQGQQIVAEQKSCVADVRSRPKFASLEPHHVNSQTGRYSMIQMADMTTPSPEEATLFAAYWDEVTPCMDKTISTITPLDPRTARRLHEINAKITALNLQLISRTITWGQYAQDAMKIIDEASGPAA